MNRANLDDIEIPNRRSYRFGPNVYRDPLPFLRYVSYTDVPLLVLSILWLPVFITPYFIDLSANTGFSFEVADSFVWSVFVADYVVRFLLAPDRAWHFRHNLAEFIIVVLPIFRTFRFIKVFRIIGVGVVGFNLIDRLRRFMIAYGLHYALATASVVLFVGSWAVLIAEVDAPKSNLHSYGEVLWWAAATLTTVGYGDHYPVTPLGQALAVIMMFVGIAVFGFVTASVASYFVQKDNVDASGKVTDIEGRMTRIESLIEEIHQISVKGSIRNDQRDED